MSSFEWREQKFSRERFIYYGSLWVNGERFANLIVEKRGGYQSQVTLNFQREIIGKVTYENSGLDFLSESFRTQYVMEYVERGYTSHYTFQSHCVASYWLSKNVDRGKGLSPKEKCKFLFPLLKLEDIPELMVLLDRFQVKGGLEVDYP